MDEARTGWESKIVGHAKMNPAELMANPDNWREHPPVQEAALSDAIDEIGFLRSVTFNQQTNRLVDGHLRVELAIKRGEEEVDVEIVDLTEEEEARALAYIDPLSGLARANRDRLRSLLDRIKTESSPIQQMLTDLREREGAIHHVPPSLDDLAKRFAEPTPDTFWPVIEIKVPPLVHAMYRRVMFAADGGEEYEKFAAILLRSGLDPGEEAYNQEPPDVTIDDILLGEEEDEDHAAYESERAKTVAYDG